ncbi:MAG: DUF695 domain-containing protein [Planctomycetota bacterium]
MSLGWEFYATELDGDPIGLLVDLDVDAGSQRGLETLVRLHVPMPHPLTTGLTSEKDFELLEQLEDAVAKAVEGVDGRFVGRISYRKEWVFYAFVREASKAHDALDRAAQSCRVRGATLDVEKDPEWSQYHTFLKPFPETMRHILNRRAVEALVRSGDDADEVRPMTHEIEFATADAAGPIRDMALERKYVAEIVANGKAHALRITKESALDIEGIDRTSIALMRLSDKHGGRYLGWSCAAVAKR